MIRNELTQDSAIAENTNKPEIQPIYDTVSEYKIGNTIYRVRVHFNLECEETLADVVGRLIIQDLNETDI